MTARPDSAARDLDASLEKLLALLDSDEATNRLLARHPRASHELLEKLSHSSDKATRRAVASHPNTPPPTLVRLGQQFPKEFLANPALDLLLMVNPDLIEQAPQSFLIRLLKQVDCPTSLLVWAAGHSQAKVQLAVAMNAKAPEQALEKLQSSKHPSVREAIQSKTGSESIDNPEKAFEQAVKDRLGSLPFYDLIEAWKAGDIGLAQWAALPIAFRLTKACDDELPFEAIAAILRNTSWTLEAIQAALPNSPWWEAVPSINSGVPAPVLEAFARNALSDVRQAVADNPSVSLPILHTLQLTAQNPSLRVSFLEEITEHYREFHHIRCGVAANPSSPASLLEVLAADPKYAVRLEVAGNPSTASHVLEVLAADPDGRVRLRVAANPSSPPSLLEILASDSHSLVLKEVAGNPSTLSRVLEVLAAHPEERVRLGVAGNPSAPAPLLELLASDRVSQVRRGVAGNPSTPARLLAELSENNLDFIGAAVASNTSTPTAVLARFATDHRKEVLRALLGNPKCPFPAVSCLARANDAAIREVFAAAQSQHSDTSSRALWADRNERVRHALAGNEKLSPELLDELAQSAQTERDMAVLLSNKGLRASTAQSLADKLLTTEATESPWYQQQLSKATPEVVQAAKAGSTLSYFGKDPTKTALAKRPMAPVMALCAGPFVDPGRIVKLASATDWLVRAAAARNQGTPERLLKKLAADVHPLVASLARNTRRHLTESELQHAERPVSSVELDRAAAEIVKRAKELGLPIEPDQAEQESLSQWVMDDVWGDRVGIDESLSILARYEPSYVFRSVIERLDNKQITLLFEKGGKSSDTEVRQFLAKNQACPANVFSLLERDEEPKVLLAALRNPMLPISSRASMLKSLLKLRGEKLLSALRAEGAPSSFLEEKSKSRVVKVREAVAFNPSSSASLLEVLAADPERVVREKVAGNPSSPASLLEVLAADPESRVRGEVAGNPSSPASLLEVLVADPDGWVRREVAGNPSSPPSLVEAANPHVWGWGRRKVAGNPSSPASLLEVLAADPDEWVRREVAGNPSSPATLLEILASDPDSLVRREVAGNPSAPATLLEVLAADSRERVRQKVAGNPSAPASALERMAKSADVKLLRSLAFNSSSPKTFKDRYIQSWGTRIARALQRELCIRENKPLDPQVALDAVDLLRGLDWLGLVSAEADNKALTKASRSKDWLTRLGAALHPSATEGILKLLTNDGDLDVARAAARPRSKVGAGNEQRVSI